MWIRPKAYLKVVEQYVEEWPREACGFLVEPRVGDLGLIPVPAINVSDSPLSEFVIDPERHLALLTEGANLRGTYHSHPRTSPVPSGMDRETLMALPHDWVHLIVGSDENNHPVVRAWVVATGSFTKRDGSRTDTIMMPIPLTVDFLNS